MPAGRPPKYDQFLDGRVHELIAGRHFSGSPSRVQSTIHGRCRDFGLRCKVYVIGDRVHVQAVRPGEPFTIPPRADFPGGSKIDPARMEIIARHAADEIDLTEVRRLLGGVSRQRVQQLLRKLGFERVHDGRRLRDPLAKFAAPELEAYVAGDVGIIELLERSGYAATTARGRAAWYKKLLAEAGVVPVRRLKRRIRPLERFVLDDQEIRDYLLEHESARQIAARRGVSTATVYSALARQGVQLRNVRPDALVLSDADRARLADRQIGPCQLAGELGVTPVIVYRAMHRQGVEIR